MEIDTVYQKISLTSAHLSQLPLLCYFRKPYAITRTSEKTEWFEHDINLHMVLLD